MSRDRGPVLKRARALGIEPQYLGVNKKSKRHGAVRRRKKLLAVACNVDSSRYAVDLRLFAVLLNSDLDAVRHLFVVVEEDLLADNLRGEETQCLVGQRIFGYSL